MNKVGGFTDISEDMAKMLALPRVQGAAPAILGKGMIESHTNQVFIDLKGIDTEREKTVTELERSIRAGSLDALNRSQDETPGILIGVDLAKSLEVSVGDQVKLLSTRVELSPFGAVFIKPTFEVAGIFSLGLYEYDSAYGIVQLDAARRLLGAEAPAVVELRVDDMFRAEEVARAITDRVGVEYFAQSWSDLNKSLFSALWLEKMAISITIGLIVMVAALNIIASLISS
ncbi:MAG: ABC transporter permease [Vicinamibacterales bacterium]